MQRRAVSEEDEAWDLSDLSAVHQEGVGERTGEHGFGDGNGADADTGVVAAFGDDLDLLTLGVHRTGRDEHGGGRFDREARDERVAAADPAENAA